MPFLVRIEDKIFLNGVIDQLWLSNDFYHVLDLKQPELILIMENYHLQLNLYKLALDRGITKIGKKASSICAREIRDAKDMDIDFNFNNKPSPVKTGNCSICDNKYICFPIWRRRLYDGKYAGMVNIRLWCPDREVF